MEERKRPATYDNEDSAPPLKKQVTSGINGGSRGHQDVDMPGKDELERFQKEAILRQMQEYKREKNTLQTRLNDLTTRSAYHDDHLRVVDAWFSQLLDEVKISLGKIADKVEFSCFPSKLLSSDTPVFEKHLKSRSDAILSTINHLFSDPAVLMPGTPELQARIADLLLAEKIHIVELERLRIEKDQMEERLETASERYILAEKKLERAKSLTVAKLERQAIAGGRVETTSSVGSNGEQISGKHEMTNGSVESSEALNQVETARKAAVAASEKQREQLEQLTVENEKLAAQVTSLTSKLISPSDEDYAQTDLFKHLKSQHEDVIKRINDLEATNIELRDEAEKLKAERMVYQLQLDTESQAAVSEKEVQLAKAESDLSRVRTARDELHADVQLRKAAQDHERASLAQMKQLTAAREDRIKALESELERIKLPGASSATVEGQVDGLLAEELRTKYANLERQYAMLNQELASMGAAYKKAAALGAQKVSNLSELEEKVGRLGAEKSRADQKYFAAMKAKDAREQEVRTLRAQNSKSSDIVSQLKDAEASTRSLVANLEKNVVEAKEALSNLTKQQRLTQAQLTERTMLSESLKKQGDELKAMLLTKDSSLVAVSASHRQSEVEVEKLRVELEDAQKKLETWKAKGLGNENEHYEVLRNLAICTICRKNFKNTAIKVCGHVFCRECVEDRIQNRMRKCPNCNKPFGIGDHMRITL